MSPILAVNGKEVMTVLTARRTERVKVLEVSLK